MSEDEGPAAVIKVTCLECGETYPITDAVKFGKRWRDSKCHSAYRWLTKNDPEWESKTAEQKRATVIANRDQGGRGSARQLVAMHEAPQPHDLLNPVSRENLVMFLGLQVSSGGCQQVF